MNLELLKKELPYKTKPGKMNKKTGKRSPDMAFIDARQVMDLLDEVVKPENWQCDYKELGGKMYCGIAIRKSDVTDWVWKWDMGVESNFDAEKGEASDAFKRAAVKWGIGRFLYNLKGNPSAVKKVDSVTSKANWRTAKPSDKQVKAVFFKLDDESKELFKEVGKKLRAGLASDYIGNKITTEELMLKLSSYSIDAFVDKNVKEDK